MASLLKGVGLMGAGAYGYQHLANDDTWRNAVLPRLPSLGLPPGIGTSTEARMRGEVERLQNLLTDLIKQKQQQGSVTVIHQGGRSGWTTWIYLLAGVGAIGLYCRWRGISLMDLLYVSRNSMAQFKSSVTEGFSRMWEELRRQKDEMMTKLTNVGTKQEQLIDSQAQMDERLRQVGDSFDDVKVHTHHISSRVSMLDQRMQEVALGITNVQQGVMLLCHTVAEVTQRIGMPQNTRSHQALKGFLGSSGQQQQQQPSQLPSTMQLPALPGLETIVGLVQSPSLGNTPGSTPLPSTSAPSEQGQGQEQKGGGGGGNNEDVFFRGGRSLSAAPPSFPSASMATTLPVKPHSTGPAWGGTLWPSGGSMK